MTSSRRIAYQVLLACEKTHRPFQSLLDQQFHLHRNLDHRDKTLATQLVTGVLRFRLKIDWIVEQFSTIPLRQIDAAVLAALRIGVYQLLFLDRVPESAAVNEAVELVKSSRSQKAAGFVNAVMRAVQLHRTAISYPDPAQEPIAGLAVNSSHPKWLVDRWLRKWGLQKTQALLEHNNFVPPRTIRANTLKIDRESLIEKLSVEGVQASKTVLAPEGLIITGGLKGSMYELPSYAEGLWEAQDEGAQLISHLVPCAPGMRILDLCAGRGVKSGHLSQLAPEAHALTVVEISPEKFRYLKQVSARLGARPMEAINQDAVAFSMSWRGDPFDAILVDAPCTGTGVLRRQPDAKWKNFEQVLPRMVNLQRQLLEAALRLAAEGGTIVYATCSMEFEENEENIDWVMGKRPDLIRVDVNSVGKDFIRACADSEGYFRLWPPEHNTDGFFAAVLRKQPH
jgi:16S rRNA (cytosine967-C5)-methyltransferase